MMSNQLTDCISLLEWGVSIIPESLNVCKYPELKSLIFKTDVLILFAVREDASYDTFGFLINYSI